MRIVIFSQYFWPENFPINNLCESLVARDVEVEVLTGKPNYPQGRIFDGYRASGCMRQEYRGARIVRIPLSPRGKGAFRLALNYLSFVVSGLIFAPWVMRRKKFDAIFVYAPSPILQALPALLLGRMKRCPVVLWVQDLWPESLSATGYIPNRLVLRLVAQVVRYIYRHTDLILVQSRAFEQPVRTLAGDTPIEYYPNSVSREFAEPPVGDAVPVDGLEEGFTVVFAGNIGQAQAVGVIVEAARLLKDYNEIRFVVVGDGSARPWMLTEIENDGLENVFLPGRFPLEAMPGILQRASVLLVTLADREIFAATIPSKVQAYMAAGRPIIACLNGEGARLVEEAEAGLACPAEDGQALAEAVLRVYRYPSERREELGRNGRGYYRQHFDHEDLVEQLIAVLGKAAASKAARP